METFNDDEDLLRFVAHGFTVLLTMKQLGMTSLEDVPTNDPGPDIEARKMWLRDTALGVVDAVWHAVPLLDIVDVIDAVVTPQEINEYDSDNSDDSDSEGSDNEDDGRVRGQWCICGRSKW
jgi:hypothetical protein